MSGTQTVRCTIDRKASEDMKNIIQLLMLSPKDKKIIINKAGTEVRKISKRHIREQRDIDGRAFAPREKRLHGQKPIRRRMFKELGRFMSIRTEAQKGLARVGWKNSARSKAGAGRGTRLLAEYADLHQHGGTEQSGRILASKERDHVRRKDPCPRWLAKRLAEEGYESRPTPYEQSLKKNRGKKLRAKRRNALWITRNMTKGKAAAALHALLGTEPKDKWKIEVPKREFLGVTNKESDTILEDIADYALGKR